MYCQKVYFKFISLITFHLNVVLFLLCYVVAMDRTDCKVNCPLELIKYSESESEYLRFLYKLLWHQHVFVHNKKGITVIVMK